MTTAVRIHPVEQALVRHQGEKLRLHVLTCRTSGCTEPATALSRVLCSRRDCDLRGVVEQHDDAGAA